MKKSILITTITTVLASTLFFASCGAQIDKELYDETVGKNTETIPPADVKNLKVAAYTKAVALQWENPSDSDFYGVTISASPAAGSLAKPVTYINDNVEEIPTILSVDNLAGNVSYTFKVVTFDYNMNYSKGVIASAKTVGDDSSSSGSFFGTSEIFSYKKDRAAFDFGYCSEETIRIIELTATDAMNTENAAFTNKNKMGTGTFELVNIEPKGNVNLSETIKITVKYTPDSNPSWDEMELQLSASDKDKLTFIGSSFKQPKDISYFDFEKGTENGLALWLRADMIGSADTIGTDSGKKFVKRLPDYSGRGYHAYCTDADEIYTPAYNGSDEDFNNLPSIDFNASDNTKKSQLLSMGTGSDPIVGSGLGHTTFVVLTNPPENLSQAVIAANYGQSFPTLINSTRYFDEDIGYSGTATYGWSVKGSGMKDYRYPCVSNSTTDPDNTWLTNARLPGMANSICMRFNQKEKQNYDYDEATKRYSFHSNIRMQVNGKERLLSFIYSNSSTTNLGIDYKTTYSTSATCYGAYGKPISDAKGHRYGTLSPVKTPSSTEISGVLNNTVKNLEINKHVFYHWFSDSDYRTTDFPDSHYTSLGVNMGRTFPADRKWDYAYTYTPAEYLNYEGVYAPVKGKSLAQSDTGYDTGAAYYTNWISNESRRNGTIYNMIIGTDNNIATSTNIKLAEVIMFDYPLSDEEIDIVNNYIYYRYKIGSVK